MLRRRREMRKRFLRAGVSKRNGGRAPLWARRRRQTVAQPLPESRQLDDEFVSFLQIWAFHGIEQPGSKEVHVRVAGAAVAGMPEMIGLHGCQRQGERNIASAETEPPDLFSPAQDRHRAFQA